MRVNGKEIPLNKPCTLEAFLKQEGYVLERVAVEKNGEIVPKIAFGTEQLTNDDRLEVVSFVGGG